MNNYRITAISAEGRKSAYIDVNADNIVEAVQTAMTQFGFTPVNLTVMFLKSNE